MGRRPDPPALQAAKGDPGRRKGKRLAAQAAAAPIADAPPAAEPPAQAYGTSVEPPAILFAEGYAEALAIWAELGPELERTNRLAPIHRQSFGMFCIYIAEFWQATRDLAANGRSQDVKTVAGGSMERDRPAVRWRAEAFANAMEGAKQFGLTPREEFAIFKDQAFVVRESPGLFGRSGQGASPATPANDADPAAAGQPPKSAGVLGRIASAPPARPH